MADRAIWAWVSVGLMGLWVLSCSGGSLTADSVPTCSEGGCKCEIPGDVACCVEITPNNVCVMRCVPDNVCGAEPGECKHDEDCPGPPDPRCGEGRCDEGVCSVLVRAGEPIANQFPGDCKENTCSLQGEVIVLEDNSDIPDDGNPCTFDTCEGDMPVNTLVPSGTACGPTTPGTCDNGKCWECSVLLNFACPSDVCAWDKCVPFNCSNGKKDGQESSTDCGGSACHTCGAPASCKTGYDCTSGVCSSYKCVEATHTDGVKNGDETGVDCGYPGGPPHACKDGDGCTAADDCVSSICYKGVCQEPTCTDTIKNGSETGPDCGGDCSPCQN